MPNLFPQDMEQTSSTMSYTTKPVKFGRGWKFDFDRGEFVSAPSGKMVPADGMEAYMEWCQKTLLTTRYAYLIYSRSYGSELENLLGQGFSKTMMESEIARMAREALMADSRTKSVQDFSFTWDEGQVFFTCQVYSVRGNPFNIQTKVVTG